MPETEQKPSDGLDPGILHKLLGHLVRHAFNKGQVVFSEVFQADKITPLQFMMVELISKNPDVTHSQICQAMDTAASVVTTSLKPLIDENRISQMADRKDRRRVCYRMTDTGSKWFLQLRPKIEQCEAQFASALTLAQRTELANMLRLLSGLDQPDDTC